jgi:riboflavin synthase
MFTGIVQKKGELTTVERDGEAGRIVVELATPFDRSVALGESIAVNGVCLTVVECTGTSLVFDLLAETFHTTNLDQLALGDPVNIEPALAMGDPLGGHWVTGHIDGTGRVEQIEQVDRDWTFTFKPPKALLPLLVMKGSVAIDGVSLTIASLEEETFTVCIIPHTYAHTNFSSFKVGDSVNLEADLLGKYVQRLLGMPVAQERNDG